MFIHLFNITYIQESKYKYNICTKYHNIRVASDRVTGLHLTLVRAEPTVFILGIWFQSERESSVNRNRWRGPAERIHRRGAGYGLPLSHVSSFRIHVTANTNYKYIYNHIKLKYLSKYHLYGNCHNIQIIF